MFAPLTTDKQDTEQYSETYSFQNGDNLKFKKARMKTWHPLQRFLCQTNINCFLICDLFLKLLYVK